MKIMQNIFLQILLKNMKIMQIMQNHAKYFFNFFRKNIKIMKIIKNILHFLEKK